MGITLCTGPQPAITHCIMQSETKWENLAVIGELLMIIGGGYSELYAFLLKFPLNGLRKRST